ncbi:MAG: beta-propeller fold lactonase family protein [Rhodoferax sp.]|nr:beta-propeller fold lactonase family protein [Rhodoferax sp.]
MSVSVSGLVGTGLILQNKGTDNLTIVADGVASFTARVASGERYAVSVYQDPAAPAQLCQISNGGGTVATSNVSNVTITCRNGVHAAYAANFASNTLSQYALSAANGSLAALAPATVQSGTNPLGIRIDPSRRYAYASNEADNTVSQHSIAAAGELTPMVSASIATGFTPRSLAIDPSGRYAYVVNHGSNTVSQYTTSAVDGSLTAMAPATVITGNNPASVVVR